MEIGCLSSHQVLVLIDINCFNEDLSVECPGMEKLSFHFIFQRLGQLYHLDMCTLRDEVDWFKFEPFSLSFSYELGFLCI